MNGWQSQGRRSRRRCEGGGAGSGPVEARSAVSRVGATAIGKNAAFGPVDGHLTSSVIIVGGIVRSRRGSDSETAVSYIVVRRRVIEIAGGRIILNRPRRAQIPKQAAASHLQRLRIDRLRQVSVAAARPLDGERPRRLPARLHHAGQAPRLQLLQPPPGLDVDVPGAHLLQLLRDPVHGLAAIGLLRAERGVELTELDQHGMQVLPSPVHDLLHVAAQIRHELVVILPRRQQLLLVPPQLVHVLLRDALPLAHGLIGVLAQALHLGVVVVEVHAEFVGLLDVEGDAVGEDAFPLDGVVDDVFHVLVVVDLGLLVELQVDGGVAGGVEVGQRGGRGRGRGRRLSIRR
mmetsp:Transcript_22931/g.48438  ORF Transcript_22931/g.48438 Transcript_22931/m.48438 type:complete len:347 (-) Transcript_22931:479-1519(-)